MRRERSELKREERREKERFCSVPFTKDPADNLLVLAERKWNEQAEALPIPSENLNSRAR